MQAVLLIGIPATGKSTFYGRRFFDTHVRINRDMLRTRHREKLLLEACIAAGQRFVLDNTNATAALRAPTIARAKDAGFEVVGYFQSCLDDALARNRQRQGDARIDDRGVRGMASKLELPALDEGFDALHYVRLAGDDFVVEQWRDEVS